MANITSQAKVSFKGTLMQIWKSPYIFIYILLYIGRFSNLHECTFNHHLLFHYSRFSSTIFRNFFPCNSANNSFRKWQKPSLCYVVNWNLVSTLTYFANPPRSWSPFIQLFFVSQEPLSLGKWSIFQFCQNLQTRISR